MAKKRIGTIIVPPGVFVDVHEKKAVDFLASELGHDVEFLVPNRRKDTKTPDIKMLGRSWEIKSPVGKSSRTIENNLRSALRQSPYIVLDLRRMDGRIPSKKVIEEVEKQFNLAKAIKSLIIIPRQGHHIDFKR